MREILPQLNEMSFQLPPKWEKSKDIYSLPNGQGMINIVNYISDKGVISLFAIRRDPDEFLQSYDRSVDTMDKVTGMYDLIKCPEIECNGFVFPVYIVKGTAGRAQPQNLVMMQVFVNCGDCLGCFMVNVPSFSGSVQAQMKKNPLLVELGKILETIE